MRNNSEAWPDLALELMVALADGTDVRGTIDAAEVVARVGSSQIDYIVDVSDLEGIEQADAYAVMCDLVATRLTTVDQVLGCLVFRSEPDPAALLRGLDAMIRPDAVFTPVLPLSHLQADVLVASGASIDDFVDDATALIEIAADRRPPTAAVAATLLEELDELIDRVSGSA